jgi:excisionase family DNA binding protein
MEDLLTPQDARRILRISRTSVYGLLGSGRLKSFKVGRLVRIRTIDLKHFIEGKPSKNISL